MGLLDMIQRVIELNQEIGDKFSKDLDYESGRVSNMSDERLKDKALHGSNFAQKYAAMEEWKKRHPKD